MYNPLIRKTSIFQLQLEGGYDPLIYRLRPEGSCHSHCTTTTTTNHCSSSDRYSSTDHCPLYHIAHQPIQSTCPIKLYQSTYCSFQPTQSIWVCTLNSVHLGQTKAHTTQPIWVKPTTHKATCANLAQQNQPVPICLCTCAKSIIYLC